MAYQAGVVAVTAAYWRWMIAQGKITDHPPAPAPAPSDDIESA
jgi:hypothetical protein